VDKASASLDQVEVEVGLEVAILREDNSNAPLQSVELGTKEAWTV
jgi:hypothetical protein